MIKINNAKDFYDKEKKVAFKGSKSEILADLTAILKSVEDEFGKEAVDQCVEVSRMTMAEIIEKTRQIF